MTSSISENMFLYMYIIFFFELKYFRYNERHEDLSQFEHEVIARKYRYSIFFVYYAFIYSSVHIFAQIYTENHAIQIDEIKVQICGNLWGTQYRPD